ncbi:hypothetical protein TWF788_001304 [Orbilia oligospora]|uniref:Uncharacterized protein n=1 Tax=Orbilia oligospora TaxID=2813651 RepID=A0A7C8K504_ORBOL|nr:hypothetical protein TWF788_001304 [Orbilia oligospora]
MTHKTHCKHEIPRGLRCELCDHFTCSLRTPPQGLDFPELLLPPYLPPRDIQPPNYFKSMPSERKVPTETLHNMGVLCRDYSVRIEAANRLAEEEAAITSQIGLTPKRRQQRNSLSRFKILSPLAKLRIVSPEDSPNGGPSSPGRKVKYETKLVSEVFQQKQSVESMDRDWESSDSDRENDNPEDYEKLEQNHNQQKARYPHMQAEKARQQSAHLRRIWEESQHEKQRAMEERERKRQEDEARRIELESAAQEHERKRKSLARRRAEKAKLVEAAYGTQSKSSGPRRVSLARRVPNRRMSRGPFRSRLSISVNQATPQISQRTAVSTVAPQLRGTPIFRGPNRRISIRPQTVQKRAQAQAEGIAAARARKLADATALVQQRKAERMAADLRRKEESERRVQEARKKVEAEKRRSAEARQRQHEAFLALHRRNKANQVQTQSLTSKVTQKYLAPSGNTPRKLYDWQTRRNLKKEGANNLFMLTTIGHSRNFSLLPRRMQVNDDFGCLENDIYLPRVPDITTDDLRIWKMNSADIDITQGSFHDLEAHLTLAPRVGTNITPPWADRARRMASKLPEHLYYGWRICHNYGYFGWKVPKRTTRYFLQARRFGELDREWDEAIAQSEVKTQTTLEKIGKQESIPMIRIASGPLLAHTQLTDGCENDAVSASLTTSTVTSFITFGGTVTPFYDCFGQLPFCNAVNFEAGVGSLTSSETSEPTVIPAVGQPVTLSVTGSDGIPLAAELSSDGQLLLVDASTATNATVLFADGNGFLRVYNSPSQVLFLGSWTSSAGRFRRRQSTDAVSQIQSIDESNLTSSDKAGNFSFGAGGAIELNVDGVDNNFYKWGTTGQTQLYTADEGVDPGSEFDGVSVIPVLQEDLPPISLSSSSTSTSTTETASQGSSSGTGASTSSNQQSITTTSSTDTASTDTTSETGTQDTTATSSDPENSSSTSAEDSSTTAPSSSTAFTGSCPTDSANPTIFATITGNGFEAVTDIISAGGAFYTFTSSILDFSTSTSQTVVVEESISTILSQTGVIQATTTSYKPWPSRSRHRIPRAETISTPDALTRFPASNITVGCNLMVSYPVQSTVEETTTTTASGLTIVLDSTTTTNPTETTEYYMSTEVSVIVATPSSFSARLGWRRASGSLTYLEGGTISNSSFGLGTANAPAGSLTLDDTGRLVYPILDTNTGTNVNWYAAAPVVSDSTQPTAGPLMFAEEATVTSNGWQYIGFFPDRNTIFIDSSQSAGGYDNFGLCTYMGSSVEKLIIMIGDTKPNDAAYCDFRSYLNFQ